MLVFEHLDVEDGGPTAGRSGKLTTGNINWNIMFQLIFRTAVGLANDMEGIISSVKDPWRKGNGSWAWRYGRCTRGSRWRGW